MNGILIQRTNGTQLHRRFNIPNEHSRLLRQTLESKEIATDHHELILYIHIITATKRYIDFEWIGDPSSGPGQALTVEVRLANEQQVQFASTHTFQLEANLSFHYQTGFLFM